MSPTTSSMRDDPRVRCRALVDLVVEGGGRRGDLGSTHTAGTFVLLDPDVAVSLVRAGVVELTVGGA